MALITPQQAAPVDETAQAAAAFGVPLEALQQVTTVEKPKESDECEIWPCNVDAVMLFDAMRTQWRVGPHGPVGLDLSMLHTLARSRGIKRRNADRALPDLAVMECAALNTWAKQMQAAEG